MTRLVALNIDYENKIVRATLDFDANDRKILTIPPSLFTKVINNKAVIAADRIFQAHNAGLVNKNLSLYDVDLKPAVNFLLFIGLSNESKWRNLVVWDSVAIGHSAVATGANSIALGHNATTKNTSGIAIGHKSKVK